MPKGADAVVIVEHTALSGETVSVFQAAAPRQHVGRAGSDLVAGEVAVAEGTVLSPARLGVVAALGFDHVEVFQRPRVAILSTGDEIVVAWRHARTGADLRLQHRRAGRGHAAPWRRAGRAPRVSATIARR